ncbi:MAG: hypothetical protein NTV97_26285 [Alphaproteobacteria bacterium]|nr:hypothetical protein [Alphaproteobacteria bacterium]
MTEGNSFFQISMFTEADRERVLGGLGPLTDSPTARDLPIPRPIIFKGYEPSQLSQCSPLLTALETGNATSGRARTWLGEPIAIAPPIELDFVRTGGSNLLVVNRDEAEAVGVVVAAMVGLGAQLAATGVKFDVIDLTLADSDCQTVVEWTGETMAGRMEIYGRRDIPQLLGRLSAEVGRRQNLTKPPPGSLFLVILGLQRVRALRLDDDEAYSGGEDTPVKAFAHLLKYGPDMGVHTIVSVDGVTALERALDHGLLREFGFRCSGPLDARGSDTLFDTDVATRLGARPHRMVVSDEKRIGVLQTFRPYALPARQWLETCGVKLKQ